jgi:hypothetical protein
MERKLKRSAKFSVSDSGNDVFMEKGVKMQLTCKNLLIFGGYDDVIMLRAKKSLGLNGRRRRTHRSIIAQSDVDAD